MRNEFQPKTRLMTFTIISQTGEDKEMHNIRTRRELKKRKKKGIGSTTLEKKLHVITIESARALVILLCANNNLNSTSLLYGLTPCKDGPCLVS